MRLLARTGVLLLGASAAGFAVNAFRADGVAMFAWQATTVCEAPETIVAELTPSEAQAMCNGGSEVLVVDVRTEQQFIRGHIPDALHLPCQQRRLEDRTYSQLAAAPSILVYGDTTEEARTVATSLAQRNLPVQILAGGYPNWEAAGMACLSGPCEGCLGTLHDH